MTGRFWWEDGATMPRNDSAGVPEMIRGSVVVHRRRCGKRNCRCGKRNCRCAAGDLHEATVLSYSERGRTRLVMLPPAEVAAVAAAVDRYRAPEAELAAAGEAGRGALIARLAARRGRR
jgi:hypothetical protein